MKMNCIHVDTCLPGYWRGHHLPHVQIPAYRQSYASVRAAIMDELRHGAIMGSDNDARLLSADIVRADEEKRADALTRAAYAAVRRDVKPRRKGDRLAFRDIEADEDGDTVYAYFVFEVIE